MHVGSLLLRVTFNPRLPEPFFVTRLPNGGGYHPSLDFHYLTLVLLRGVATTTLTVFALVLKNAQPRG